jgi:hypothetical protein
MLVSQRASLKVVRNTSGAINDGHACVNGRQPHVN